MTPADFDDFAVVLRAFAEIKARTLSPAAIELYWRAMQDWDVEHFRAAAVRLLKTSKFMPTPADFEDLKRQQERTCGEAWSAALEHAKKLPVVGGHLQEVASGDDLLDRAARAVGGFKVIASTGAEGLPFLDKRFCERYEDLRDAEDVRHALPQLTADVVAKLAAEKRSALVAIGGER